MIDLTPDYSKKTLHVVLASTPTQEEGEKAASLHCMIYRPEFVFNTFNRNSEMYYTELFRPGQIYRTVVVETEMGPGELGKVFEERFGVQCNFWIGGVLALFTMDPNDVDNLMHDLLFKLEEYLHSKEKQIF